MEKGRYYQFMVMMKIYQTIVKSRNGYSASDLHRMICEEGFEMSARTMQRHLRGLVDCGLPIIKEAGTANIGGLWKIDPSKCCTECGSPR